MCIGCEIKALLIKEGLTEDQVTPVMDKVTEVLDGLHVALSLASALSNGYTLNSHDIQKLDDIADLLKGNKQNFNFGEELAKMIEEVTGKKVEVVSINSVSELGEALAKAGGPSQSGLDDSTEGQTKH